MSFQNVGDYVGTQARMRGQRICCGEDKSGCKHHDVVTLEDGGWSNRTTLFCKCCRSIGETTVTTTWRPIAR